MARLSPDQIRLTDTALILLEGCDPARVGRPENDGVMGVLPSGVVGGVAEIIYPVCGELRLFARGELAYPEIVVANEGRELSVG